VATKEEWTEILQRRSKADRKQIARLKRVLFQDILESCNFFVALTEYSQSIDITNDAKTNKWIFSQGVFCRNAFFKLSLEDSWKVIYTLVSEYDQHYHQVMYASGDSRDLALKGLDRITSFVDWGWLTGNNVEAALVALHTMEIMISREGSGDRYTIWSHLLRYVKATGDFRALDRFMMQVTLQKVRFTHLPHSQANKKTPEELVPEAGTYNLPIPDDIREWYFQTVQPRFGVAEQKNRALGEFVSEFRRKATEYSARCRKMWHEMLSDPCFGLRSEWMDQVTLKIPEFNDLGFVRLKLNPGSVFPDFDAQFELQVDGSIWSRHLFVGRADLDFDAAVDEESNIRMPNLYIGNRVWLDRIMMFIAVRSVWCIVMNKVASQASPSSFKGRGKSGSAASGLAAHIMRPRFRKLPVGYKMSAAARQRSFDEFGQEVLPPSGSTFVRRHKRGSGQQPPQKIRPLFSFGLHEFIH